MAASITMNAITTIRLGIGPVLSMSECLSIPRWSVFLRTQAVLAFRRWQPTLSQSAHVEDMTLPGRQIDIQPAIPHLVPVALVGVAGHLILEAPRCASQLAPRQVNTSLGWYLSVIHHNERAFVVLRPAPREDILAALVVGPTAPLTEAPCALAEEIAMGRFQKTRVEGREIMIDGFLRASAQEDRQPYAASLELALVK